MERNTKKTVSCTCGLFWGILTAFLAFWLPIFLQQTGCPSTSNGVCNNQGICNTNTGICSCYTLFSGTDCTQTLVNSYVEITNELCLGLGIPSPFLVASAVWKECLPENGGWYAPACIQRKNRVLDAVLSGGQYTAADLQGFPGCWCPGPFSGWGCETNYCQSQLIGPNGLVCSGNGLTTVGPMKNNTNNGNGCQCSTPVNLLPLLNTFSTEVLINIEKYYLPYLQNGFCGTLVGDPLKQNPNALLLIPGTMQCYCKPGWKGSLCDQGQCPQSGGLVCSGNGHPDYGFRETGSNCPPVCAPGTQPCPANSKNANLCVNDTTYCNPLPTCPSQLPFRCADGSCQPNPNSFAVSRCASGFINGYIDNPDQIRYTCTNGSQCFGTNYQYINSNIFYPNGILNFTSPLLFFYMEIAQVLNSAGYLILKGLNTTSQVFTFNKQDNYFYGTLNYSMEMIYQNYFTELYPITINYDTILNYYSMYPVPWKASSVNPIPQAQMQIYYLYHQQPTIINIEGSAVMEINNPSSNLIVDGIAVLNNGLILRPDGNQVTQEICYNNLEICSWNRFTLLSFDNNTKLCLQNGDYTVIPSTTNCTTVTNVTYVVTTIAFFKPLIPGPDFLKPTWFLSSINLNPNYFYEIQSYGIYVKNVEWLTVNDVVQSCACPNVAKNASTYNQLFSQQITRLPPTAVGQYAVGYVELDGFQLLVRGVMTQIPSQPNNPYYILPRGFNQSVMITNPLQLTISESQQGADDSNNNVFPLRCPNGLATQLGVSDFLLSVNCECYLQTNGINNYCACQDELNPTTYCKCDVNNICTCYLSPTDLFTPYPEGQIIAENITTFLNENIENNICVVSRANSPKQDFNYGVYQAPYYYFEQQNSDFFPGVPRQFIILNSNISIILQAQPKFFSDTWYTINYTSFLSPTTNATIIIPNYPLDLIYNQWRIYVPSYLGNSTLVYWSPSGIPLSQISKIGYNLTVTYSSTTNNLFTANDILYDSFTYWESSNYDHHSFLQINFPIQPQWVTAVWIDIRNAGISNGENYFINTQLKLQYSIVNSPTKYDWIDLINIKSNVQNGSQAGLITFDLPKPIFAIRLYSYFPFAINVFSPITNQICTIPNGRLLSFQYRNAIYEQEIINNQLNLSIPCVATDSCIIDGKPVSHHVCNDVIRFYGELIWKRYQTLTYSPSDIMSSTFNQTFTVVNYKRLDYNHFLYYSTNSYCLQNFTNNNITNLNGIQTFINYNYSCILTYYSNTSLSQNTDQPLATIYKSDLVNYINPDTGYQYIYYYRWIPKNFPNQPPPNALCPAGTQASACGPSCRTVSVAPGLTLPPTTFVQDYLNRTDYIQTEGYKVSDYLKDPNTIYSYNFTFLRRVIKIGHINCNDCNLAETCLDGTCSQNYTCGPVQTLCPANGCSQVDPNIDLFSCACKLHYGGTDCSVSTTKPADPTNCLTPVEQWHIAGRICPLKLKPPAVYSKSTLTTSDLILLNQNAYPYTNNNNILPNLVQSDCAPYGYPLLREFTYKSNATYCTNCPCIKFTPWGEPWQITDYVQTLDTTDPENPIVTEWKQISDLNGNPVNYTWSNICSYDEAPYACPLNGQCVSKPEDCNDDYILHPLCNKHGTPTADGTCICDSGWTTFIFTEEFSTYATVPYTVNPITGQTNPTVWGGSNNNWRLYSSQWCMAKDCTVVDCSPPKGCFPGTLALNFQDALIACPKSSGYYGYCATDNLACTQGNVVNMGVCSFNGIAKKRDYRGNGINIPEEWFCDCNAPWGGDACNQYYCTENLNTIYYSTYNPDTHTFWKDQYGGNLPGIYQAPCNSIAGPKPEDLNAWLNCCPNVRNGGYLDHCIYALCSVNGNLQCVLAKDCVGPSRTPQVAVCNGHGKILANGICECDDNGGIGYTHDTRLFSSIQQGCFKKVTCATSITSNLVCNSEPACGSSFNSWDMPYIQAVEQQNYIGLFKLGLPINNNSLVNYLITSTSQAQDLVVSAYSQVYQDTQVQYQKLGSCICVKPGDNPNNPCCMLPYDPSIVYYMKGFNYPFYIEDLVPYVLFNGIYFSDQTRNDPTNEYIRYFYNASTQNTVPFLNISLYNTYYISAIRLHGRFIYGNIPLNTLQFVVYGDHGQICPSISLPPQSTLDSSFQWLSSEGTIYCTNTYKNYNFQNDPNYNINCGNGQTTITCIDWMISTCKFIVPVVLTIDQYFGCNSYCCVPVTTQSAPTTNLYFFLQASNVESGVELDLDEIVIMGYSTSVQPLPALLVQELTFKDDAFNGCQDYNYIRDVLQLSQNEYFVPIHYQSQTAYQTIYNETNDICREFGGKSAVTDGTSNYAIATGYACEQGLKNLHKINTELGCFIGARNVHDYSNLTNADLPIFIQSSCSNFGCWDYNLLTGNEYYSTGNPYDYGYQYKYQWAGPQSGQRTWLDFYSQINQLACFQYQTQTSRQNIYNVVRKPMLPQYNIQIYILFICTNTVPQGMYAFRNPYHYGLIFQPYLGNTPNSVYAYVPNNVFTTINQNSRAGTDYSTMNYINYDNNEDYYGYFYSCPENTNFFNYFTMSNLNTYTENGFSFQYRNASNTYPITPTQNYNGKIEQHVWLRNDTCIVQLFSAQHCGMAYFTTPGLWYDNPEAFKMFEFSPNNDYQNFYIDLASLGSGTFNDAVRPNGAQTTRNGYASRQTCPHTVSTVTTEIPMDCINFPCLNYNNPIAGNVYSIAISGNCTLYATNNDGSVYYQFNGLTANGSLFDTDTVNNPLYTDRLDESNAPEGFVAGFNWVNGICYSNLQNKPNNGFSQGSKASATGNYDPTIMTKFYVYPNFSNMKVKVSVNAPSTQSGTPDVDFNMGWTDHPYMCANVEMTPVNSISPAWMCGDSFSRSFANCNPFNRKALNVLSQTIFADWNFTGLPDFFTQTTDFMMYELIYAWRPLYGSESTIPKAYVPYAYPASNTLINPFYYFFFGYQLTEEFTQTLIIKVPETLYLYTPFLIYSVDQDGNAIWELLTPFVDCQDLGRPVLRCPQCINQLRPGNYEYFQRTWQQNTFYTGVSIVETGGPISPEIYAVEYYTSTFMDLPTLRSYNLLEYIRNIAAWRVIPDYQLNWYLNLCLAVTPIPGSNNNTVGAYQYTPVVCEQPRYILCQADFNKYLVQPGMQCDKCPTSYIIGNSVPITPNGSNCFSQFPYTNSTAFPLQNQIYQAGLHGTLYQFAQENPVDADIVLQYLYDQNLSFALAFPAIVQAFDSSTSTCPGFLSYGQTQDDYACINMDFASLFPIDCGLIQDPSTGASWNLCASHTIYCSFTNQIQGTNTATKPTVLNPVNPNLPDLIFLPRCGILLQPYSFYTRDKFGPGSPDLIGAKFLSEIGTGGVQVQALGTQIIWQNTGKNPTQFIFNQNSSFTNIAGIVTCSQCQVQILISDLNPTYDPPQQFLNFSVNLQPNTGKFNFTVYPSDFQNYSSITFQCISWNITNLLVSEIIEIQPIVISNTQTIQACTNPDLNNLPWYSFPSTIVSGQLKSSVCIKNEQQKSFYNAPSVGVCVCLGRAYGGPACDQLALDTINGKFVCGNWGTGPALEYAPDGTIVSTNENGAYYYGTSPNIKTGCKCRDIGALFLTRLNPLQGSGFATIVNSFQPFNSPYYELITPPINQLFNYNPPFSFTYSQDICNSASDSLPFWLNADQLTSFYDQGYVFRIQYIDFYVDPLNLNAAGSNAANYILIPCVSCVSQTITSSTVTQNELKALNFNNLCFEQTNLPITNGLMQSTPTTFPFNITVNSTTLTTSPGVMANLDYKDVYLYFYSTDPYFQTSLPYVQTFDGTSTCTANQLKITSNNYVVYTCTGFTNQVENILFYLQGSPLTTYNVSAIACFLKVDTTRTFYFSI